ncbi:hemolysin III family protein [Collinsella sp. AGMB00827]|uniref:Hemolysin III family protein n=1 Tax=Collinsella ureilytica TaxID=2869515 RepID=A0ABS7MKF5_9ACTN|nr:hemolysin III family protein [Collinsella urealyticum]MBY4797847.1 hemolysin III family protein [Collinsella urealyticum]
MPDQDDIHVPEAHVLAATQGDHGSEPSSTEPDEPGCSSTPGRGGKLPQYTVGEEIANSITHGVGFLLAVAGLVLLIIKAALGTGGAPALASAIVFGISLILEYLASTLYHAIQVPAAKRILRIIDHSCIYLLIAGSYTPFLLVTLADDGGIPMFVLVWALAIAGISFELAARQRQPRWVTILIYLIMGWLVVFRFPQLIERLDPVALALLAVGGLCYTAGTGFYLMKHIRYMHSIWHLWVLAGSIFQFMAVILFVI